MENRMANPLKLLEMTTTNFNYSNTTVEPPSGAAFDIEIILNVYWEYRMSRRLGTYGYPVILFIGTLGNILNLIVMTRKSMIKSATCFYMALLAVAETMLLYFACLRRWYSYLTKLDAFVQSSAACKTTYFLTYWSMDFAAWILVAMTIERFIAVHFPFSVSKQVTVGRAKKVSVGIGLVLLGINGHTFFTLTIDEKGYCRAYDRYIHFTDFIFPWIDAAIYSFVPFIVLLIFNIFIIIDWRKAVRRQIGLRASVSQSRPGQNVGPSSGRLTAMLLSVSLAFLIATAPKAMLIIIEPYIFDFYDGPMGVNFHLLSKYTLTAAVMNFLMYANHALNFFLYCINGQRFRKELKQLFLLCIHRKRRRQVTSIRYENGEYVRNSFELRRNSVNVNTNSSRNGCLHNVNTT